MSTNTNQFAQDVIPCATSTQGGLDFGFVARNVQVINDRAAAIFLSLNSTTPSTGGFRTCAGETFSLPDIPCSGMAIASTTTSTGTLVRVRAFGG